MTPIKRVSARIGMAVAAVLLLTTVLALPTEATALQPLTGVRSITSGAANSCALLTSGKVDCWGDGRFGELGNGRIYTAASRGSAVPVAVEGVGGSGTLAGVASLAADDLGFCALLTSGKVDCWGNGVSGQLGNGRFYGGNAPASAVPVAVKGVGRSGTLSGVSRLLGGGNGFCALLVSSDVDCWGAGNFGQLGNGNFYTNPKAAGSDVPVTVDGVGGSGTLDGVRSLYTDSGIGFCALLTSSEVVCWGAGNYGELGNGTFYPFGSGNGSAVPVAVEGVGGVGTLGGVASLTSEDYDGSGGGNFCALLISSEVDCWGDGQFGQLGNGKFDTTGNEGSAVPVAVKGMGGTGVLTSVTSLVIDDGDICALLTSAKVDCWGDGYDGEVGNGKFYTNPKSLGSDVPAAVKGAGGAGTLDGVASLTGAALGSCALLTSGGVDCWGYGYYGELGNGRLYTSGNAGSAVPVAVEGVDRSGTLAGVGSLSAYGMDQGFCGRLRSGEADCWGEGGTGQLGNGTFDTQRAAPVVVIA